MSRKPFQNFSREGKQKEREGGGRNAPKNTGNVWIYGRHAAMAAIKNPARKIHRIVAAKNFLADYGNELPSNVEPSDDARITTLAGRDAVHQGIVVEASPLPELNIRDIDLGNLIILLDQVTDPHNVGAMMRSASAFGAKTLITTERNSPSESGVLAKAASGAMEYVNYVREGNLAETIRYLKTLGFWIIGMDGSAKDSVEKLKDFDKIGLVMGAEGKGMRLNTRAHCDLMVKIPMDKRQESLNVSNAAAIALWEASKR